MDILELGNLDAKRDWGFAGDYVDGMYKMVQVDEPDTYILATNRTVSVREFVKMAFNAVDIEIFFEGVGKDEVGRDLTTGKILVKVNPAFYRPAEVDLLIGNPEKAKKLLNWEPKTTLEELCKMMVDSDLKRNQNGYSF